MEKHIAASDRPDLYDEGDYIRTRQGEHPKNIVFHLIILLPFFIFSKSFILESEFSTNSNKSLAVKFSISENRGQNFFRVFNPAPFIPAILSDLSPSNIR